MVKRRENRSARATKLGKMMGAARRSVRSGGSIFSAEAMGRAMGVTRATIGRWERGISSPNLEQLEDYCRILIGKRLDEERAAAILAFGYPGREINSSRLDQKEGTRTARDRSGNTADVADTISLSQSLRRLGVFPHQAYLKAKLFSRNETRLCIGSVISLHTLNGSDGIPGSLIDVRESNRLPTLPSYVKENLKHTRVTGADRKKVFLQGIQLFPSDEHEGIHLEVSVGRYSVRLATQQASEALERDLVAQKLRLSDDRIYDSLEDAPAWLSTALHCDGVILTGDGKVLLAQRGSAVNAGALLWTISCGEGMEWDVDRDHSGRLSPVRTIWRGLKEEFGIDEVELGSTSSIRFFELAFDITSHVTYFPALVEVRTITAASVLERARRSKEYNREKFDYDILEFTPEACALAITDGVVGKKKLIDSARFNLLLACLHKFPSFERTLAGLVQTRHHK